jgi:hypothetical protein
MAAQGVMENDRLPSPLPCSKVVTVGSPLGESLHTYGILWGERSLTFLLDGQPLWSLDGQAGRDPPTGVRCLPWQPMKAVRDQYDGRYAISMIAWCTPT